MNRLEIIGHIGQDATVKDFNNNQVINFTVAVTETYTNKTTNEKVSNTTWFDCSKWGNNTALAQYLKKGMQVYVSGKPTARAWQNEQGEIKTVLGVNVHDIKLLGSRQESTSQTNTQPAATQTQPQQNYSVSSSETEPIDDLPF